MLGRVTRSERIPCQSGGERGEGRGGGGDKKREGSVGREGGEGVTRALHVTPDDRVCTVNRNASAGMHGSMRTGRNTLRRVNRNMKCRASMRKEMYAASKSRQSYACCCQEHPEHRPQEHLQHHRRHEHLDHNPPLDETPANSNRYHSAYFRYLRPSGRGE